MTAGARVEHVGSLLRPEFLRDARDAYARGELTPAGLKAAEDRAVREAVAMQEEVGLPVVGTVSLSGPRLRRHGAAPVRASDGGGQR